MDLSIYVNWLTSMTHRVINSLQSSNTFVQALLPIKIWIAMHTIYLSLGTNLGDRLRNLQKAISSLSLVMSVTAVSPIYQSEPWGVTDQPPFLNLCLKATTSLNPQTLLHYLKNLETELGRQKTIKWGSRLIDIDILFYDDTIVDTNNLTIPHPRITERAFVLVPLADIAPDLIHPIANKNIAELKTAVDQTTLYPIQDIILLPTQV